jgi:hypothetical protein
MMQAREKVTVNSRNYDLSIRRSWTCELISNADEIVILRGVFENEVLHPDLGHIEQGTISYEYFWFDRWYNIFRFHEPSGSIRNFYCNIGMPPAFDGRVLNYVDLDIDVLVWPDMTHQVLDEAEFAFNAHRWNYPESIRLQTANSLHDLLTMIADRTFPFSEMQQF